MEKSPLRSCRKARTFDPYRLPDSVKRSRRRRSATLDPHCSPLPFANAQSVTTSGQKPTQVCNLSHEPRFEETQHAFGQRLGDWLKRKFGGLFSEDDGTEKTEGAPGDGAVPEAPKPPEAPPP